MDSDDPLLMLKLPVIPKGKYEEEKRLDEIDEHSAALWEMQAEVEKEMGETQDAQEIE